jgi:hypothetical protein
MTISKNFNYLLLMGLLTPACVLLGVEPDEIGDGGEGVSAGSTGDGDGENGVDESDSEAEAQGDGDGDGEPGDGDGDDPTGDGDGDASTGDGDGDGDPSSTGDGDGECAMYEPIAVVEADNAIEILDVMSSFDGDCGFPGPDAVFSFTATSDASYEFKLTSDAFEGALYLVAGSCDPLEEIACDLEGQAIIHPMGVGEVVYIIVDSDAAPGAATLSIVAI